MDELTIEKTNIDSKSRDLQDPVLPAGADPDHKHSPWRRFFARSLDLSFVWLLISAVPIIFFHYDPDNLGLIFNVAKVVLSIVLTLLLEPLFLSRFGTTPGKWFLGIRVTAKDGSLLTWQAAMNRTVCVLIYGTGGYIPVLESILEILSMNRYDKGEDLRWDREACSVVSYPSCNSGGILIARWIAAFILIMVLTEGTYILGELPVHHNDLTVEQFADNFNRYSRWYECGFELNSDGTWKEGTSGDSVSAGEATVDFTSGNTSTTDFPLTYTVEDGILTGISWSAEWEGESNYYDRLDDYDMIEIAAIAFTRGQKECPLFYSSLLSSSVISRLSNDIGDSAYECDDTFVYDLSDSVQIQMTLKDDRFTGNQHCSAYFSISKIK